MGLAKTEEEWGQRASAFLKAKMKEADVTYAELVKRLKKHGLKRDGGRDHDETETGNVFPRHSFWHVLRRWRLKG